MERFDIESFNKSKNRFDEEYIITNGIEVKRMWEISDSTYNEFERKPKDFCTVMKSFYVLGNIKSKGRMYEPGSFPIGIWEYYDSTGKLVSTKDYDKLYKVSYKEALKIASAYYGFHQQNLRIDMVGDDWMLENIKGPKSGMAVFVNQTTAKHRLVQLIRK